MEGNFSWFNDWKLQKCFWLLTELDVSTFWCQNSVEGKEPGRTYPSFYRFPYTFPRSLPSNRVIKTKFHQYIIVLCGFRKHVDRFLPSPYCRWLVEMIGDMPVDEYIAFSCLIQPPSNRWVKKNKISIDIPGNLQRALPTYFFIYFILYIYIYVYIYICIYIYMYVYK